MVVNFYVSNCRGMILGVLTTRTLRTEDNEGYWKEETSIRGSTHSIPKRGFCLKIITSLVMLIRHNQTKQPDRLLLTQKAKPTHCITALNTGVRLIVR